jgi:vitamin B12 transporter
VRFVNCINLVDGSDRDRKRGLFHFFIFATRRFTARTGFSGGPLIAPTCLLLLILISVHNEICAQQPTQSTTPPSVTTTVTVSSQALPLETAPASVTVVTRELIEIAHADNFADLLRKVPSLYLSQTGGYGGLTTITIRGAKPNFTLVLLDGIPINDIGNILGGSFDFSSLSPDNIERIEIVRGPLSSLYGSEAIGGVINIISRPGESNRVLEVGGELGNFETYHIGLSTGGEIGRTSYALTGSYLSMGPQIAEHHYSLGTAAFNATHSLDHSKILQFVIRFHDKESSGFPENGGGPLYSILPDLKTDRSREFISGLSFHQEVRPWWQYGIEGDLFLRTEHTFTPPILDRTPPTFNSRPSTITHEDFRRIRLSLPSTLTFSRHLSADMRVGYQDERGSSDSVIAGTIPDNLDLNRPAFNLNGGVLFQSGRLTASVGVGINKTKNFHASVSPRTGASYRVGPLQTYLKASWGTGFSLPSFEALGDPLVGNPHLTPEQSRGFDAGIEQTIKPMNLHFSLVYYWNSFRNLIDFSPEEFRLVNRSLARTQGFEWSTTLSPIKRLDFNGHLTFLNAQLLETTDHLRDLPRWRGGFGVIAKPTERLRFTLDSLWIGRRYDFQVPIPSVTTVGKYATTSLSVSLAASARADVYLRIDNLFNSHYEEFLGFPNAGIYARIGLNYKFFKSPGKTIYPSKPN